MIVRVRVRVRVTVTDRVRVRVTAKVRVMVRINGSYILGFSQKCSVRTRISHHCHQV